jgi:hypothetical protein
MEKFIGGTFELILTYHELALRSEASLFASPFMFKIDPRGECLQQHTKYRVCVKIGLL